MLHILTFIIIFEYFLGQKQKAVGSCVNDIFNFTDDDEVETAGMTGQFKYIIPNHLQYT